MTYNIIFNAYWYKITYFWQITIKYMHIFNPDTMTSPRNIVQKHQQYVYVYNYECTK